MAKCFVVVGVGIIAAAACCISLTFIVFVRFAFLCIQICGCWPVFLSLRIINSGRDVLRIHIRVYEDFAQ